MENPNYIPDTNGLIQSTMKKGDKFLLDDIQIDDPNYRLVKSTSSCRLEDILGFVYGGSSSRFWMFRKYTNNLSSRDIEREPLPFYSWECLTLQLVNRDVYLVIRDEKHMENILKILIDSLDTIDGNRGSRAAISESLDRQYKQSQTL